MKKRLILTFLFLGILSIKAQVVLQALEASEAYTSTRTYTRSRTYTKECSNDRDGTTESISYTVTGTGTSAISQADADANALSNAQSNWNDWMNANGQIQANNQGECTREGYTWVCNGNNRQEVRVLWEADNTVFPWWEDQRCRARINETDANESLFIGGQLYYIENRRTSNGVEEGIYECKHYERLNLTSYAGRDIYYWEPINDYYKCN